MASLSRSAGPFEAAERYAYIDTVELFFRYPPKGLGRLIEIHGPVRRGKRMVNRVMLEPCRDSAGHLYGHRLIVHQPTRMALRLLAAMQAECRGTICRLDLAIDFITPIREALRDRLARHTLVRWRPPKDWMRDVGDTIYWTNQSARRDRGSRRSRRDLVLYADQHSKVTGEVDCVHLELRFYGTDAVRRAGFARVRDLLRLSPRALFERNLSLVDDFEADKAELIAKMQRRAVRHDRNVHRDRPPRSVIADRIADQIRASIPRRINRMVETLSQGRAQLLRDHFGMPVQRMNVGILRIPNQLENT